MAILWLLMAGIGAALLLLTFVADTFEVDLPGTDAGLPAEAISGFLTASGLIGFVLTSTGVTSLITVPAAIISGLAMGGVTLALVRFFMHTPTDPTPTHADFVGAIGKVITPIPAGGIGEVLVPRHGQPWKVAAQLTDEAHDTVDAGSQVVVVAAMSATRVLVTPSDL